MQLGGLLLQHKIGHKSIISPLVIDGEELYRIVVPIGLHLSILTMLWSVRKPNKLDLTKLSDPVVLSNFQTDLNSKLAAVEQSNIDQH